MLRDNYPSVGKLCDNDTGILLKEYYNGASSTIHRAERSDGSIVAIAKDRTSLVRKLNKIYK